MASVSHESSGINPFAFDFNGYPDELPPSVVSNTCPGDRVVHADHWQGTLDSPAAAYEPSDEDLRDYQLWLERLEVERECNARFV